MQPRLEFGCESPQSLARPALPDAVACTGVRQQPRCFLLQPNRRQIPVDLVPSFLLRLPFLGNALQLSLPRRARNAARSSLLRPLCPMVPAKPHTRPNTASRAGLRLDWDFPIQAGKAAFGIGQPVPLRSAIENAQHIRFFQTDRIRKAVI